MGGGPSSCAGRECKVRNKCCGGDEILGHLFLGSASKKRFYSQTKNARHILTSKQDISKERQVLRCHVHLSQEEDINDENDDLIDTSNAMWVFCWVSNEGTLHHHYKYEESNIKNKKIDHEERTYTGDAFVLYRVAEKEKLTKHPMTIEELCKDPSCSLICSYQLDCALDPVLSHHCLEISSDEELDKKMRKKLYDVQVVPKPQPDNEYRVIIRPPMERDYDYQLPPFTESWEIVYEFIVPSLPRQDLWDSHFQTLYVWGDLDFAQYDYCYPATMTKENGNNEEVHPRQQLHRCTMNQIVPQVMTGRCLSANHEETFVPSWNNFESWVIQAQYFWQTETSEPRALCGPIISVEVGELLRTCIRYEASTGNIHASIEVVDKAPEPSGRLLRVSQYLKQSFSSVTDMKERKSEIIIPRPFMHNPALFSNWKHFFEKCQNVEEKLRTETLKQNENLKMEQKDVLDTTTHENKFIGPRARPGLCVEYKGKVNVDVIDSLCPFEVTHIQVPGISDEETPVWRTELFCPRMGHVSELTSIDGLSSLHLHSSVKLAGIPGGIPTSRLM